MISAFLFTTWSMKPIPVREAVAILDATRASFEEVVERGDVVSPRDLAAHLQPLRVLELNIESTMWMNAS